MHSAFVINIFHKKFVILLKQKSIGLKNKIIKSSYQLI